MKKIMEFSLIIIICFFIIINPVAARAGGGTSSGGSSSSGGSTTHTRSHSNNSGEIVERIVGDILFLGLLFSSTIILKVKLTQSKRHNKSQMKRIEKNDKTWNYKELDERVVEAYFIIQEAWKNKDLKAASNFMSNDLLEQFQIKLNWMEVQNKENIMDKIELIDAIPVSLYDHEEDEKDYI